MGDAAGLTYYPTNSRVYMVNKKTNQVLSFLINGSAVSRPVVSVQNAKELASATDMAIDGSLYVLNANGVVKYYAGKPAEFNFPQMFTAYSGSGKIQTGADFKYIYILDIGNNRIIILDKRGTLVSTLTSRQFTQLQDFQVDEKAKIAWVLNGGSLLKVILP
jgi:hypothetical protein